ncbi:MAG: prephenate dehydrogenase [Thiothrix sp.]
MIRKLVIFGVGLIGGSLALALRQAQYCEQVVGCSRNAAHLQKAVELGVIDCFTLDPQEAVQDADMVLLAVPMGAMAKLLQQIKPVLPANAILTDAGSTKGSVVAEVEQVFGKDFSRFVPGHPIAGREQSGVEAAIPDLFVNRRVILTPQSHTAPHAIAAVSALWQASGAIVEYMAVDLHDQVLAATSHLPHVLAFSLVDTLLNLPMREALFRYAAGGFRDFTRIASSDPTMWRDICLANHEAIVTVIEKLQADLSEFAALMQAQDGEALYERMLRAKQARDSYIAYLENGKLP